MQTIPALVLWPALAAIFVLLAGLLLLRRLIPLHALLTAALVLAGISTVMAYRDYSWAASVHKTLANDSLVIRQQQASLPYHPWTRVHAPVTAISVISQSVVTMETNGKRLLELELQDFDLHNGMQPVIRQLVLNCERQDLVSRLGDGILIETLPDADPLLQLLCQPD